MSSFFRRFVSGILVCGLTFGSIFTGFAMEGGSVKNKKSDYPVTITVGKGDGYQFNSIQSAINSIELEPTETAPATIVIAEGVYEEAVTVNKPYVKLKNEKKENSKGVVITYDKACGHIDDPLKNVGTQKSATFTVEKQAVGFSAESITFQNSYNLGEENANREQVQAVAFVSLADKVILDNCRFIGRQDTLYLKGSSKGKDVFGDCNNARVYLKNCYIEGTVDFIFGDATAYFDECTVNMAYSEGGGHYTAANSTLSNIGFVFKKCNFTADSKYGKLPNEKIDLGRPWQSNANYPYYGAYVALIDCSLPYVLNPKGFVPWDSETVTNKLRYMEYGSIDELKKPVDYSQRNEFVVKLTAEQSQAYTVFNILRGSDNWNPTQNGNKSDAVKAVSISLDNYNISIPKYEKYDTKAFVLPLNAQNGDIMWKSADENIASVDKNGIISALNEGKTKITVVSADEGFSACAEVNVIAARTLPPTVKEINMEQKGVIVPNDTVTVSYLYELKSDDELDCAKIRWYAVSEDGKEILLKQGDFKDIPNYTVKTEDIGYKIKAVVYPETKTSYGKQGLEISVQTESKVAEPNSEVPKLYIRDGFDSVSQNWKNDGFYVVESDSNKFIAAKESAFIAYNSSETEKAWDNVVFESRLRFNPDNSAFSAEAYYDFYSAFAGIENSYYKLRIKRGENTNSLKVYFYKKSAGENETLVMSDEASIKDNLPQAKGENNPYFRLKQTINNGVITTAIFLDNEEKPIMSMTYKDEQPLTGFIAFANNGSEKAVIMDSLTVCQIINEDISEDAVRIYLAGDSTVKSYGSDNTIGGWGEYIQYYFDSKYVKIINKAEGGRSTRSYINQGRLDEILNEIRPNDYLFIQFGHNDARTDDAAYLEHSVPLGEPDSNGIYPTTKGIKTKTTQLLLDFYKDMPYSETFYSYDSGGNYKWFLKQYIEGARAKGAIPVLITPVARVFFDSDGKITPHHGTNDEYVKAVLQVAEETNTLCVDMFQITKDMYESYGIKVTQGLQNIKSDGTMDITHYNKFGSNIVTSKLVAAIKDLGLPIAQYEIASSKTISKTEDLKNANVFIAGESMAAGNYTENNENYSIPRAGWGDYLQKYFVEQITVKNFAKVGESSKSFINTENYKNIFDNIGEGDYLLIQFGNGDANKEPNPTGTEKFTDPSGATETKGSFKYWLYNFYVKPAQNKKAIPILIAPDAALCFDENGNSYYDDSYSKAVQELAAEFQLYYVDMNVNMKNAYIIDEKDCKDVFNAAYKDYNNPYSDKGTDRFNYNKFGAEQAAKVLLKQLGFSSATLKNYINSAKLEETEFISRGEFICDLVSFLKFDGNSGDNFSDVIVGKNYYEAVGLAKQHKIAKDSENNLFRPEDNLKKEELEEFVYNLLYKEKATSYFDNSVFNVIEDGSFVTKFQSAAVVKEIYNAINK